MLHALCSVLKMGRGTKRGTRDGHPGFAPCPLPLAPCSVLCALCPALYRVNPTTIYQTRRQGDKETRRQKKENKKRKDAPMLHAPCSMLCALC